MGVERKEGKREGEREMGVTGWELPHVLSTNPGDRQQLSTPDLQVFEASPHPQKKEPGT